MAYVINEIEVHRSMTKVLIVEERIKKRGRRLVPSARRRAFANSAKKKRACVVTCWWHHVKVEKQRKARVSPLCMIIKFRAVAKTQSPSFSSFLRFNRGNEWKRDYCHLCNCFVEPETRGFNSADIVINDNFSIVTINI